MRTNLKAEVQRDYKGWNMFLLLATHLPLHVTACKKGGSTGIFMYRHLK